MSTQAPARQYLKLALFAAFFGISLTLLAELFVEQFMHFLLPPGSGISRFLLILVVLFGIFAWALFVVTKSAGSILGIDVATWNSNNQKALPFLVMGYSPIGSRLDNYSDEKDACEKIIAELNKLGPAVVSANAEDFQNACKAKDVTSVRPNSWQQNLRSAWHHRSQLEYIFVLNPSRDQFDLFKSYMDAAFKGEDKKPTILLIAESGIPSSKAGAFHLTDQSGRVLPADYENYDYVYFGLSQALQQIRQCRAGLDTHRSDDNGLQGRSLPTHRDARFDELTCIDITAGQKIFSIAAAALTLNRPLKFSYVNTEGVLRFFNTNLRIASRS